MVDTGLKGKTVLVTGANHRIGAATAAEGSPMKPRTRKLVAAGLAIILASYPGFLMSKTKRGASVVVTFKDQHVLAGELIAVKKTSLLLLDPSGKDQTVEVADIAAVQVRGKSHAGTGLLIGFGLGALAGTLLVGAINDSPSGQDNLRAGFWCGAIGALPGAFIGAIARDNRTYWFEDAPEASVTLMLDRLRSRARYRDNP